MTKITHLAMITVLILASIASADIVENFTANPNWTYQALNHSWPGPAFSSQGMILEAPNTWQVRVLTPFTLTGDFEVVISGLVQTPSNWTTHIKHYIALTELDTPTTDPQLQLLMGSAPEKPYFTDDTHYAVNLAQDLNYNATFTVRFLKQGPTISAQAWNDQIQQWDPLSTYTMADPHAPLTVEFAEFDGTGLAYGLAQYTQFRYTSIPEASMASLLVLGTALYRRRQT